MELQQPESDIRDASISSQQVLDGGNKPQLEATPLGYPAKYSKKASLTAHRPKLNPLIHLAMSPTAAPNNTPVESSELASALLCSASSELGTRPPSGPAHNEVLPPLRCEKKINAANSHVTNTPHLNFISNVKSSQEDMLGGSKMDAMAGMGSRLATHENSRTPMMLYRDDDEAVEKNIHSGGMGSMSLIKPESGAFIKTPSDSMGQHNHMMNSHSRDLHVSGSAMTPKRLHFDYSTEKIDPGAGISSISTQKINITSLLNSRSTADSISPPPSTAEHDYVMHFPPSSASNNHSSGSFLQPRIQNTQLPSSLSRIVSPTYTSDMDQNNILANSSGGHSTNTGKYGNIAYQPKTFNTKFDELRNRVLLGSSTLNPRLDSSQHSRNNQSGSNGQDSSVDAEAAAIISQMRSSPLPSFNEQFASSTHDTRPSSSLSNNSFQSNASPFVKRTLPKPIIRVNQKELKTSQDENAILEEDDEYSNEESHEYSNTVDTVAWNKNGKRRLSRRKSGPPHYNSRLLSHQDGDEKGAIESLYSAAELLEHKGYHKRSRSSSLSTEPSSLLSPNSKRIKQLKFKESNYNNETSNEQIVKSSDQIKKRNATGARSRTGCWICRLRKKKCTEEKPECQNCIRLHLECFYDIVKPDFISDPVKKTAKLEEIKKKTKEAKRQAMKKKSWL